MAIGKNETPRTFVKLKTKGDKPSFDVMKKNGEGKWEVAISETYIDGFFKSLRFIDHEYEGKKSKKIQLILHDQGMDYIIESFFSSVSRGILNTLAAAKEIGFLKLQLAVKDGYPRCYVEVNGNNRPEWALEWADQKVLIEVIKKKDGSVEKDYFDLNKKLMEICEEVKPLESNMLDSISSPEEEETPNIYKEPVVESSIEEEEDDGLPF